jgi:hypothetical protein
LNPHYAVGAEGAHVKQSFESVRVPITAISFTDDEMMSACNTDSLHGFYTDAAQKMVRIAPERRDSNASATSDSFRTTWAPSCGSRTCCRNLQQTLLDWQRAQINPIGSEDNEHRLTGAAHRRTLAYVTQG